MLKQTFSIFNNPLLDDLFAELCVSIIEPGCFIQWTRPCQYSGILIVAMTTIEDWTIEDLWVVFCFLLSVFANFSKAPVKWGAVNLFISLQLSFNLHGFLIFFLGKFYYIVVASSFSSMGVPSFASMTLLAPEYEESEPRITPLGYFEQTGAWDSGCSVDLYLSCWWRNAVLSYAKVVGFLLRKSTNWCIHWWWSTIGLFLVLWLAIPSDLWLHFRIAFTFWSSFWSWSMSEVRSSPVQFSSNTNGAYLV